MKGVQERSMAFVRKNALWRGRAEEVAGWEGERGGYGVCEGGWRRQINGEPVRGGLARTLRALQMTFVPRNGLWRGRGKGVPGAWALGGCRLGTGGGSKVCDLSGRAGWGIGQEKVARTRFCVSGCRSASCNFCPKRWLVEGEEGLQERVFVFLLVETPFLCSCSFWPKETAYGGEEGVSGAAEGEGDWAGKSCKNVFLCFTVVVFVQL